VSLGDAVDIDVADCLDYFALDYNTRAILLYVEAIRDARKFLSAARAAAPIKPVIIIKGGWQSEGARAAATHTGAVAGSDKVYDAVFRRVGLLRVYDLDELFSAAETLTFTQPFSSGKVAVLTNGGGTGVLGVGRLIDLGGSLSTLSAETLDRLDRILPAAWSHGNPVDVIGDSDAARYAAAFEVLPEEPDASAFQTDTRLFVEARADRLFSRNRLPGNGRGHGPALRAGAPSHRWRPPEWRVRTPRPVGYEAKGHRELLTPDDSRLGAERRFVVRLWRCPGE
jgi:hypothetical protein